MILTQASPLFCIRLSALSEGLTAYLGNNTLLQQKLGYHVLTI